MSLKKLYESLGTTIFVPLNEEDSDMLYFVWYLSFLWEGKVVQEKTARAVCVLTSVIV